jgi:hypothetical protein
MYSINSAITSEKLLGECNTKTGKEDIFKATIENDIPKKKTPWSESASELYRPSDRRLSAKLLPTFADKGCHVFSVTDPYGRILDRSRYFYIRK